MTTQPWEDPETKDFYDPAYVELNSKIVKPAIEKALLEHEEELSKIEDPVLKKRAVSKVTRTVTRHLASINYNSLKDQVIVTNETFSSIDGEEIQIRVYKPKNVKPNNALYINFHGGGFILGDLENDKAQNYYLATKAGVTVIDVHYRLIPEWTISTSFYDSYAFIKYAYENHAKYGIDPNKISIGGTSAGGKIVIAAAFLARDLNIPIKLVFSNVPPVESLNGVKTIDDARFPGSLRKFHKEALNFEAIQFFNAASVNAQKNAQRIDKDIVTKAFQASIEQLDEYQHTPLDVKNFKNLTKHVVYVGEHDVLADSGKAYAKKLVDENVEVTFEVARGLGHGHTAFFKLESSKKYLTLLVSDLKRLQAGEL